MQLKVIPMKSTHRISKLLFAYALTCVSALAAEYTITGVAPSGSADRFYGLDRAISEGKVSPVPPSGKILSTDDVIVLNYYDIYDSTFSVNKFDYTSNGMHGKGLSIYGTANYTFKEGYFRVWYDKNPDDVRDCEFINLNNGAKWTVNGSIMTSSNIRFGQSTTMFGAPVMTFNPYAPGVESVSNVNNFVIYYGNNGNTSATLNINEGAIVKANGVTTTTRESGHTYDYYTVFNINGGALYLGGFTYSFSGDNFTINHLSGTFGAKDSRVALSRNGLDGTLKYVIGSNAVFDTSGRGITFDSSVDLVSASGVKGGLTIKGGGDFILNCSLDAVTGNVVVSEGTYVSASTGWFNNAQSVRVGSGSFISLDGDPEENPETCSLVLNSNSKIIIDVADEYNFGYIMGGYGDITITTSDGSYGALQFVIDADAFAYSDSITMTLNEVIGDTKFVDWDAFDISAGEYAHVLNGDGTITFMAVPEPGTVAVLAGLIAMGIAVARRSFGRR